MAMNIFTVDDSPIRPLFSGVKTASLMHLLQLDVELSILELSYKNDRGNTPANQSRNMYFYRPYLCILEYITRTSSPTLRGFMKKTCSM
jgi:hypothetical protein